MENEVNVWFAEEGVRLVQIFGNIAQQSIASAVKQVGLSETDFVPSDVLLVIAYDKLSYWVDTVRQGAHLAMWRFTLIDD